jgi:hypothetical protein
LLPNKIDLYCRWLYQTARADGQPRMLRLYYMDLDYAPIFHFVDRLKQVIMVKATCWPKNIFFQDFLMATDPINFSIQIILPKAFQLQEGICLDNGKTKERFQTQLKNNPSWDKLVLLISRYLLASNMKKWIAVKEIYEKKIYLTKELKVVAI